MVDSQNKKYNILIKKAVKKNSLDEVKKILWKVYDIYNHYSPKFMPGILLYILKNNSILFFLSVSIINGFSSDNIFADETLSSSLLIFLLIILLLLTIYLFL